MTYKQKIELWINASNSANVDIPHDEVLAEEIGCSPSHVNHVRKNMDKPSGILSRKTKSINRQS